jgi:hypothetical protein
VIQELTSKEMTQQQVGSQKFLSLLLLLFALKAGKKEEKIQEALRMGLLHNNP